MTDLNEMWTELEKYQPLAEKHGFGDAWLRMTTERTQDAATAAANAAEYAAKWAQRAIQEVHKAIAQEEPL